MGQETLGSGVVLTLEKNQFREKHAAETLVHKMTVKAGETFEIRLPGQATAGYLWEAWHSWQPAASGLDKTRAAKIELMDFELVRPKLANGKPPLGGGDLQVFRFRAGDAGSASLQFQNRRFKRELPVQILFVELTVK